MKPIPKSDNYKFLRGGSWVVSCEVLGLPFMHYIASPETVRAPLRSRTSSAFAVHGMQRGRSPGRPLKRMRKNKETCALCGGEFVEFDLKDIKVPENNIYTWFGYFDIE